MAKKNANNWSRRRNNFTRIMFKFEFLSRVFFFFVLSWFIKICENNCINQIRLDFLKSNFMKDATID